MFSKSWPVYKPRIFCILQSFATFTQELFLLGHVIFLPLYLSTLTYENQIDPGIVNRIRLPDISNLRKFRERFRGWYRENIMQETLGCLGNVPVELKSIISKMVKPAKATYSKIKLQAAGCFFIHYCHRNIFIFLPLGIKMQLIHHSPNPLVQTIKK